MALLTSFCGPECHNFYGPKHTIGLLLCPGTEVLLFVFYNLLKCEMGFPCSSVSEESACSAGDPGSIPGLGRSSGEGNGNPLQYPCLENLMDRGTCWAAVHGVAESGTTERLTLTYLTSHYHWEHRMLCCLGTRRFTGGALVISIFSDRVLTKVSTFQLLKKKGQDLKAYASQVSTSLKECNSICLCSICHLP